MVRTLILGDTHADWRQSTLTVRHAIKEDGPFDQVIQVGDMGFGWPGKKPWIEEFDIPVKKWIDGNHENFAMLNSRDEPNFGYDPYHVLWPRGWESFLDEWRYMPRGTIEDGVLYIGGAKTPPWASRNRGIDWWPEESISYEDEERTLDSIETYEGDIHTVISHDCPTAFVMESVIRGEEYQDGNRKFLEHLRQLIEPERWFFGHYHAALTGTIEGCQWRCVDMVPSRDYAVVVF